MYQYNLIIIKYNILGLYPKLRLKNDNKIFSVTIGRKVTAIHKNISFPKVRL